MSNYSNLYGAQADTVSPEYIKHAKLGVHHASQTTPQNPRPGQPVTLHITVGPQIPADTVFVIYSTKGDPVIYTTKKEENNFYSCLTGTVVEADLSDVSWNASTSWGYLLHFKAALPAFAEGTRVSYFVFAWSHTEERAYFADTADLNHDEIESFSAYPGDVASLESYARKTVDQAGTATRFVYHVDTATTPAWAHDAIFYQIFLDRFHPGPDKAFHEYGYGTTLGFTDVLGGTLAGVRQALPYLQELGVTALWFSPCYPSKTHHGYDVADYQAVNPRLGTLDEMKALVAEIHARGMYVILDFVPNHASSDWGFFQQAISDENSPYRDWFYFMQWPHHYESFFAVQSLPKINTNSPAAREYLIESARFWLEEVGIDGFRMDHAQGLTTTFWSDYRATIKDTSPHALTIGEITESSPCLAQYQGKLDGVLDFIWVYEARKFFIEDSIDAPNFEHFLRAHDLFFPDKDFLLPTFLDNHDMNRFLWSAYGDVRKLKLAALCQFTQAAPPVVYYGTEIGLMQERDVHQGGIDRHEESRVPMLWNEQQDKELLAFYRWLIHFRREHPVSYKGERIPLLALSGGLLAYARQYAGETMLVVLNNSDDWQKNIVIALKGLTGIFTQFKKPDGQTIAVNDKQEIELSLAARTGELLLTVHD